MPSNAPSLCWYGFHTHKRGNTPDEYEDAFAADPEHGCFSVADGASESSFAGPWARLLAEGLVAAGGRWSRLEWLARARDRWAEEVGSRPLPWYAEMKRDEGSFATLLGAVFGKGRAADGPNPWRALAVGDSCLLQVRGESLLHSFPVERASDFGSLPLLLGSRPLAGDAAPRSICRARGRWKPGDRFPLMTDALAEWTLRQAEEGGRPADDISMLLAESSPQEAFAGWVEERRRRGGLRNDDVTLLIIDL